MGPVPRSMRAVRYSRAGPAADVLSLATVPVPQPGHGEVLVQIAASGVNPHDTKKRSGWMGAAVPQEGVIPHSDGAGTIVALGPAVRQARLGERVLVFGAGRHGGTAADYVCVAQENALPLPEGMSFEQGAAIGVPAFTAYRAVLYDEPVTGWTVLVHGGAGAVGRFAVEMAHWNGATVIATVSTDAKAAIARGKGADHVINYREQDVAEEVRALTDARGVDLIVDVDFAANMRVDADCIRPHGRIESYSATSNRSPTLTYYDFALKDVTLHFVQGAGMSDDVRRAGARTITALIGQGRLEPELAARFALEETSAAHELMESGNASGKIVVVP